MKTRSKKSGLVWGGLFIVLGVMALLEIVTDLSAWIWVAVLAIALVLILGPANLSLSAKKQIIKEKSI